MAQLLLGTSVLSRQSLKIFLKARNPTAPLELVDAYFDLEPQWQGIRADLLFCQMGHETGFLSSWWSQPPRRNLAGIGVTGESSRSDPQSPGWAHKIEDGQWYRGYLFPDWTAAVQAHFAHMSAYCLDREINNASRLDPRYHAAADFLKSKGFAPARLLTDLNGKWAVPGPTYGQTIEEIFNKIRQAAPAPDGSLSPSGAWTDGVAGVVFAGFGPGTVNSPGSYIRARPSFEADAGKVIRTAAKGDLLYFSGFTDSGPAVKGGGTRWYLIADSNGGGWIYSGLIS